LFRSRWLDRAIDAERLKVRCGPFACQSLIFRTIKKVCFTTNRASRSVAEFERVLSCDGGVELVAYKSTSDRDLPAFLTWEPLTVAASLTMLRASPASEYAQAA